MEGVVDVDDRDVPLAVRRQAQRAAALVAAGEGPVGEVAREDTGWRAVRLVDGDPAQALRHGQRVGRVVEDKAAHADVATLGAGRQLRQRQADREPGVLGVAGPRRARRVDVDEQRHRALPEPKVAP
jgi:hypothetical protein